MPPHGNLYIRHRIYEILSVWLSPALYWKLLHSWGAPVALSLAPGSNKTGTRVQHLSLEEPRHFNTSLTLRGLLPGTPRPPK
eukprot:5610489-Pyramimonas_sp.AAC.1